MTTELMTYKRQRDKARERALKYKDWWRECCEELTLQSEKFELLAREFRRIIGADDQRHSRTRSVETKESK